MKNQSQNIFEIDSVSQKMLFVSGNRIPDLLSQSGCTVAWGQLNRLLCISNGFRILLHVGVAGRAIGIQHSVRPVFLDGLFVKSCCPFERRMSHPIKDSERVETIAEFPSKLPKKKRPGAREVLHFGLWGPKGGITELCGPKKLAPRAKN